MDGKSYFDGEGLKITDAEFEEVKISNLSHRPNSVTAYGGKALSAKELKEKYDAPTKMIKDKFNGLIDEIVKIEGPNSAEQVRRANEESRQEAETERERAENGYTDDLGEYHPGRVANEQAREAAETERVNAEAERDAAEKKRTDDEAVRVANEQAREAVFGDLEAAIDAIIEIQNSLMGGDGV